MEFDNNYLFIFIAVIAVFAFGAYKYFSSNTKFESTSNTDNVNNSKFDCDGDKCYV